MGGNWPIRVDVELTLHGLRFTGESVPAPLHSTTVPWLQIAGRKTTGARLVDAEGHPLTMDGRGVAARFKDEHQRDLAWRMLKRELRRQWKSHALDLRMQFIPPRRRDYVFIALFLSAWAGALLAAGFPMLLAPWGSGPLSLQIMGFSMVFLQVVGFPAVMISVMIWLIIRQSSPVSALRITRDSVEFTTSSHGAQVQPWRNLRDRRDSVLLFTDGSRIRLPAKDARLYALYDLLDADILRIAPKTERLATPWMFVRLAIVGLLLGAGALWIFHWLIAQGYIAGPLPTGRILFASAMGPAILGLGLLEVYGKSALTRWINGLTRGRRKRPTAGGIPGRSQGVSQR